MTDNVLKATLAVAFSIAVAFFTWKGCKSNTAEVDLQALKSKNSNVQAFNMADARKNFLEAVKSKKGFPAAYEDFTGDIDPATAYRKVQKLDSMREYGYSALLLENIARVQATDTAYIRAGRQFISAAAASSNQDEQMFFGFRAQENLQKAKDMNPASIAANTDLALCYLNNPGHIERPEEAMRPILLLLEVVKQDPDNIDANYLLAIQAERTGQNEKAIERYKKLISLQPQNPDYLLSLSQLYAKTGNSDKAAEYQAKYEALVKTKEKINLK